MINPQTTVSRFCFSCFLFSGCLFLWPKQQASNTVDTVAGAASRGGRSLSPKKSSQRPPGPAPAATDEPAVPETDGWGTVTTDDANTKDEDVIAQWGVSLDFGFIDQDLENDNVCGSDRKNANNRKRMREKQQPNSLYDNPPQKCHKDKDNHDDDQHDASGNSCEDVIAIGTGIRSNDKGNKGGSPDHAGTKNSRSDHKYNKDGGGKKGGMEQNQSIIPHPPHTFEPPSLLTKVLTLSKSRHS